MASTELKQKVTSTFKINGFSIRSETAMFLAEQLSPSTVENCERWLDSIITHIRSQDLKVPVVEISHLQAAIKDHNQSELDDFETFFSVISAYEVPRFKFNEDRKKFAIDYGPKSFLPNATHKGRNLAERYKMLWHRTMRHELFSPNIKGTTCSVKKFQLKRIDSLLACSELSNIVVLGYLAQLTEGKFYLEDPTGVILLDISKAQYHSGLFCEGCFVLAEGNYRDGRFFVSGLGFPPPETASSSRAFFDISNTWGGRSKTLLKNSIRLRELENFNADKTIVFLSDCCLDKSLTLNQLNKLFIGYNECPPIAIVLMGPFITDSSDTAQLKSKLNTMAEMLNNCQQLKEKTHLVLVPSLDDPASAKILPRPPLPEFLCRNLIKAFPRTSLATNPCRLQYCTQEIVVCKADLVTKFCRNAIYFPQDGKLADHFSRTLICQSTLAPLNPIALSAYWDHDAALSLYPLPDVIVVGDPSQGFQSSYQGCTVINTGSFVKSKFSFKVYIPFTRTVEDSQIQDDME